MRRINSPVGRGALIGENVTIGDFCIIDDAVKIGKNTRIMNYVELRSGTVIGEDCFIDSHVVSSGDNWIGDRVILRYGVIVARGCHIDEDCYICPQVMFNNLDHDLRAIGGAELGPTCFIGTQAVIGAGIKIAPATIIGACSLVTKSIPEAGVYTGVPARRRS